ncbi:hypothetical protein DC20_20405 [Rufibacter tibetensis]|uniref:Uncharacterized protein n=1 Tax=Rufibacter tibetensis TaxID=512763 RepID=A0A0P0CTT2_9BACT|nr:hypothetical protein DC20_20405 [Rufibacter tibetensis]
MSKSEVYSELFTEAEDENLRRVLASSPPPDIRRRDRILHKLVCWAWVLIFLMEVLGAFDISNGFDSKNILSLAGSFFLLYQLWRFNGLPTSQACCGLPLAFTARLKMCIRSSQ